MAQEPSEQDRSMGPNASDFCGCSFYQRKVVQWRLALAQARAEGREQGLEEARQKASQIFSTRYSDPAKSTALLIEDAICALKHQPARSLEGESELDNPGE